MDLIEQKIVDIIDEHQHEIIEFGRDIFQHAELGYKEFRTAQKFTEFLQKLQLPVQNELAITGVKGYISGQQQDITLALIGELDALRIAQHPFANPSTEGAHACGHHAQLAGVIGAAIALSDADIRPHLAGNVVLFAVPSEEYGEIEFKSGLIKQQKIRYGGGKSELIRIGAFDDIDLSLAHHSDQRGVSVGQGVNNGFVSKAVRYIGKASHAAARPEQGINAVNASSIGLTAIAYQRETFRDEDHIRIHTICTKGGDLVNVIPGEVKLESLVRGKNVQAIKDAAQKYDRALKAGAYAIGADIEIETLPGYLPTLPQLPHPALLAAAQTVVGAAQVRQISPDTHIAGSTDVGDLQHIQPVLTFKTGGVSGELHALDFKVSDEYEAYIVTAKIFALTAYKLLKQGALAAKQIVADYQPQFTKQQYIQYMESFINSERFDSELNLIK